MTTTTMQALCLVIATAVEVGETQLAGSLTFD